MAVGVASSVPQAAALPWLRSQALVQDRPGPSCRSSIWHSQNAFPMQLQEQHRSLAAVASGCFRNSVFGESDRWKSRGKGGANRRDLGPSRRRHRCPTASGTPLVLAADKNNLQDGNPGPQDAEIQVEDICKVYGKRTVVDGVNLCVRQGEVVGLLGPNGAGKSTVFNLTVGRERPSHGRVLLNGRDITPLPLDARARLGLGYLTQEASIFRGLSVSDNLLLILQETGVPPAEHASRIQQLLADFRLTHVEHTLGKALSGGERRRTELARALASHASGGPPKILLVDEPFAGVDPIGVAEIQGLLRQLCEQLHMGILITDHNVAETLEICDRAYMVYQGRVLAQGPPRELVHNPFVRQCYLGEGYTRQDWQSNGGQLL